MDKIVASQFITKEFQVSEAIKTLRTNLMFSGSNIRAVALTSFGTSEGKSTISFQLAASLAQAGKRVLLVDADPQGNTSYMVWKYSPTAITLKDALTDDAIDRQAIRRTRFKGVDIVK